MNELSSGKPIRIAFVGAGPTGRAHIQAFRDVPNVTLVGIYNRTREKAQALADEFGILQVVDSIEELYRATQADLVVVTVSILSVASVLRECMSWPWAVFAEKPPGMDALESRHLLTEAAQCGSRIYVALNRRAMSSTRVVLEDLQALDEPRFIQVFGQEDSVRAATVHPPEVISRFMYANSIHVIDYLRVLGRGEITEIQVPGRWDEAKKTPVSAWVKFSSGDIGAYTGVWDAPSPWAVSVTTSSKRWELRPLEKACFQRRGEYTLTPVDPHEWDRVYKPGFRYQAEQVVRAIAGLPSQAATLEDAVTTMNLIETIYA